VSTFIIVTRNPHSNKLLTIVEESCTDEPQEFEHEGDANQVAEGVGCCRAWGYEVLELNLPRHKGR
jgi:hypothetical protein